MKTLNELTSIGNNTIDQREATRRNAANWVRRIHAQEWDTSVEALTELVAMLGLHTDYDSAAVGRRATIRDCGPMTEGRR
jgi:hypothetical protein